MLRSAAILNALVDTRNTVAEIQSTDVHGAVLTLRRTADLAITTASTTITWQAEVRAYQITWATTDITIPEDGWYLISLAWRTSVNINDMYVRLVVNGNFVNAMANVGDVDRATGVATFVRYFVSGDIIRPYQAGNPYQFIAGIEGHPLLTAHQQNAVGHDFGD